MFCVDAKKVEKKAGLVSRQSQLWGRFCIEPKHVKEKMVCHQCKTSFVKGFSSILCVNTKLVFLNLFASTPRQLLQNRVFVDPKSAFPVAALHPSRLWMMINLLFLNLFCVDAKPAFPTPVLYRCKTCFSKTYFASTQNLLFQASFESMLNLLFLNLLCVDENSSFPKHVFFVDVKPAFSKPVLCLRQTSFS